MLFGAAALTFGSEVGCIIAAYGCPPEGCGDFDLGDGGQESASPRAPWSAEDARGETQDAAVDARRDAWSDASLAADTGADASVEIDSGAN